MAVYIPGLRTMMTDRAGTFQKKFQPASWNGMFDIQERQTLYILSATVGESYFDSITVNYAQNIITFNQMDRSADIMADAVLKTLHELGIREFAPRSLSFQMLPPNR